MSSTHQRHDAIAKIVRSGSISSQEELQAKLVRKGFRVTQPTLSRDLREMGVVKTPAGYALAEGVAGVEGFRLAPAQSLEERLDTVIRELVLSAETSGAIVVLKTPTAEAQPVARAFDEATPKGVLGTLGGDDTVFVATRSTRIAKTLAQHVDDLVVGARRRRA